MDYKKLIIIPVILLVFSIGYLYLKTTTTGLNLDIDLKGGTQISAESANSVDQADLERILKSYSASVRVARGITGTYSVLIEFDSSINADDVIQTLKQNNYNFDSYSTQTIGPTLGAAFFQQAQVILIFAFIFMAITVFIIYRIPVPSFYVVLAGFADITEALAFSQILGIPLSLATFASLLLLLGYSVDTNILLTTRVLKGGESDIKDKIGAAMKTGLTMIGATAAALFALFFISTSTVITQIASVLLIGLIFGILNTWITNAALLRIYIERRRK